MCARLYARLCVCACARAREREDSGDSLLKQYNGHLSPRGVIQILYQARSLSTPHSSLRLASRTRPSLLGAASKGRWRRRGVQSIGQSVGQKESARKDAREDRRSSSVLRPLFLPCSPSSARGHLDKSTPTRRFLLRGKRTKDAPIRWELTGFLFLFFPCVFSFCNHLQRTTLVFQVFCRDFSGRTVRPEQNCRCRNGVLGCCFFFFGLFFSNERKSTLVPFDPRARVCCNAFLTHLQKKERPRRRHGGDDIFTFSHLKARRGLCADGSTLDDYRRGFIL